MALEKGDRRGAVLLRKREHIRIGYMTETKESV